MLLSDPLCDPCRSSPCAEGSTCKSKFKGEYTCTYKPYGQYHNVLVPIQVLIVDYCLCGNLFPSSSLDSCSHASEVVDYNHPLIFTLLTQFPLEYTYVSTYSLIR